MADVNHVILIGRLTRDAALTYTSGGTAVCKFAIANDRRKKVGDEWKDETSFYDVVLWGKRGEAINQYLVKGKQVAIDGELHQNRWTQDGQNRSKIEIVADEVELLGGGNQQAAPDHQASTQKRTPEKQFDGYNDQPDPSYFPDDVPF